MNPKTYIMMGLINKKKAGNRTGPSEALQLGLAGQAKIAPAT